jgi:Ca2+-binding RTX toxin-like protein
MEITATNTTFSGNVAYGGGGGAAADMLTVTNSTFVGNASRSQYSLGGGAFSVGLIITTNSIFLSNTADQGDDIKAEATSFQGLNIIGIGTDSDKSDHVINAASLGGVFVLGSDGKALLADNGGLVKTIKLVNSSTNPALDASNASAPANDARGVATFDNPAIANAQGSARDLGAYELEAANVLPTLTLTKTAGNFSNTTNTKAAIKVARIAVTDPDSTPSLSLSGADANLFQIKGNALYLKAGTTLNALTNPGLDVTVRADDPANGAGVDVAKSLSFGVSALIQGTPGTDRLVGGDKFDIIKGFAGNDFLTGGGGRDLLTGGKGADTFIFKTLSDSKPRGLRDVITDFSHGQDHIDLRVIDADTAKAGNQAFTFIAWQGFNKTAGELRAVVTDRAGTELDKTVISGDVNGDGKADFQVELTGTIRLDVGDFYL